LAHDNPNVRPNSPVRAVAAVHGRQRALVEGTGDCHAIRLIGFRRRVNGSLETLRGSVLDINRDRWRANGQAGAFVHFMANRGDDLLLRLALVRYIRARADGALV